MWIKYIELVHQLANFVTFYDTCFLLYMCSGVLRKVLAAEMALAPHSMQVERIVSSHNLTDDDKRSTMSSENVNNHLLVSLNGCGTANFDPRPAVGRFLTRKDRRFKEPDPCVYKDRAFVAKFFRHDGKL